MSSTTDQIRALAVRAGQAREEGKYKRVCELLHEANSMKLEDPEARKTHLGTVRRIFVEVAGIDPWAGFVTGWTPGYVSTGIG